MDRGVMGLQRVGHNWVTNTFTFCLFVCLFVFQADSNGTHFLSFQILDAYAWVIFMGKDRKGSSVILDNLLPVILHITQSSSIAC